MKRVIYMIVLLMIGVFGQAQEYQVKSGGKSKTGGYITDVEVFVKKDPKNSARELAMKSALRGVMFRGLQSEDGLTDHKPLIQDATVEQTKSAFFNAFFNEDTYKRYATVIDSSLSTIKNKKTKMYEVSATVIVDKESLLHYLEESNIISGFSELW